MTCMRPERVPGLVRPLLVSRLTGLNPVLSCNSSRQLTLNSRQQSQLAFNKRNSFSTRPVSTILRSEHHRSFTTTRAQCAELILKVPPMAESITEGTLVSFAKDVGDRVEADDEIATIETDKIDVSVNVPEGGVIKEYFVSEGDTVTVGQNVARIETGDEAEGSGEGETVAQENTHDKAPIESRAEATSSSKINEDPTDVPERELALPKMSPSPKEPTISESPKQDSKKIEKETPLSTMLSSPGQTTRGEHRVKMNRMRMRIAERLKQSQNNAASLTTFNEVDMSALIALRKKYKDEILETHGARFGFMGAFTKAATLALRDIPEVNASIENGDTIVFRDYVDISIAVSSPKGLVTPVLRNCQSLNIVGMEKGIAEMAKKARDGKMTIEDMSGGNFTISNGGVFGSMMGTPIINLPQTAVLGLHGIKDRAVVVDGKIEVRPMMYLALTYDHRLLDGRESVKFLVAIKNYIEDPSRMLLD